MSEPPSAAHSTGVEASTKAIVDSLVRRHNLLILVVFVGALLGLAIRQATPRVPLSSGTLLALGMARIALPLAGLVATALYTNRLLTSRARQLGQAPASVTDVTPLFERSKTLSMALLAAAAVFADACLAVVARYVDLLLAAGAFGLLLLTRPNMRGVLSFVEMVETARCERFARRDEAGDNV